MANPNPNPNPSPNPNRYGLGFYPGTGAPTEVGEAGARGKSVNVAFRHPGMGDAEYRLAFEKLVMPMRSP